MHRSAAFVVALAERVAPDEIDTVPALLALIEKSPSDWQDRQKATAPVIGGWTGLVDATLTMPDVLLALQHSWHAMEIFLELTIVSIHAAEISKWAREVLRRPHQAPRPPVPDALIQAITTLSEELKRVGVSSDRAPEIANDTIALIATDTNSTELLKAIKP